MLPSNDEINWEIVEQLMELDEEDKTFPFAGQIMRDYFEQMEENLGKLGKLIQEKNYEEAAGLGHFLKGSSAAVGAIVLSDICDKIQHYDTVHKEPSAYLSSLLAKLKAAYPFVKSALK